MQYLLLIYENEKMYATLSEAENNAIMGEYMAFTEAIGKSGHMRAGNALQPTQTATTVRVKDGKTVTTDGPFAETREQLGGYTIIDAKDLDDALAVAKGFLASSLGPNSIATIEVRPIVDYGGPVPTTPEVK